MSFSQFFAILKARWMVPAIAISVLVAIALLLGFLLPKKYLAEGSLVVESRSPDPINGTMLPQNSLYLSTQMDIIRSYRVAKMVIRELRLTDNPALIERWKEETNGEADLEAWISEMLLAGLEVTPERGSSVITVGYEATDPAFAAVMANQFIKAYIETNLDMRVAPAKQFNTMFDDQLEEARTKLEAAQRKLSAFQQEKGIIATDERIDVETGRLTELSGQLVMQQSVMADITSRNAQSGMDSPDSSNNAVVVGLRADLARQIARVEQESARLGSKHPQIVELKAGIEELKQRIRQESMAVGRTTGVSLDIAKQREAKIRSLLEAQRARVLGLKSIRDEAALLAKDVESAQRSFDNIQSRASLTSLESQINQTNVSVLKYATRPYYHSSPRKLLFVLQAIFVGIFLGIGGAILLEMRNRRVRVDEDLSELIGAENLGSMPAATAKATKTLPIRFAPQLPSKALLRLPASQS